MASGNKYFGKRIKELRESKGYTQERLAEIVGLEYQTVSRIETGYYFTGYENLIKLADAVEVPLYELFNYSHFEDNPEVLKSNIQAELNNLTPKQLQFLSKIIRNLKEYFL